MKIIFFGSDDFAQEHLECLIQAGHDIAACVTQPDRARNRGMKIIISPIKECAIANDITVLQPTDLMDEKFLQGIKQINADLFVVIAYGKFLPEEVLFIPRLASINVHGSYLPEYRGAAPINWAIINGEKETGVSIIKMNAGMDAGDIVSQKKMKIGGEDTSIVLRQRMIEEGKSLLIKTISSFGKSVSGKTQDHEKATFAPKLTKELGRIDWNKSAIEIRNLVRGLLPWPSAYTFYKGKMLKVLESDVVEKNVSASKPGEMVDITSEGVLIATSKNALLVKKVHYESSKPMDMHSFLRGHQLTIGEGF